MLIFYAIFNGMNIEALREIQKENGLTDQQLADILGFHRTSWARIKNGKNPPSARFVQAVREHYPSIFLPADATNNGKPSLFNRIFGRKP